MNVVRFADNEVYSIKGMTDPGKNDDRFCCSDNERAKAANSKWDSESYSSDRFFEILIKYFIEKGKIDLSKPEFLEYYDNVIPTWKDIVDDCLNCNAIMHEG